MDDYWATLGIGPWQIVRMEPPILTDVSLRGKPVEASILAAIAQSGNIQLELIQPLMAPAFGRSFLRREARVFIMSSGVLRTLKWRSPR